MVDKGYRSNETIELMEELGLRGYISEPDRGRRRWKGKETAREGTHANRGHIRSARGRRPMRLRGELVERSFAHCLESGHIRRTWLCGHANILKRHLVHVAAFNLGIVMRRMLGAGTPRGVAGLIALAQRLSRLARALAVQVADVIGRFAAFVAGFARGRRRGHRDHTLGAAAPSSTTC